MGEKCAARISYRESWLEIMVPLPEHEKDKELIGDLVKLLLDELKIDFEPFGSTTLKNDRMRQENGWLWCRRLGFWLRTWEGTIDRGSAIWVRFYDVVGNLVLLPEEAAKSQAEIAVVQAEEAKAREEEAKAKAAKLAARLRELGENSDML